MSKEILEEIRKEINPSRPNLWGAMRDILIASLRKGQFIPGLIGFCIIIGLVKMSPADVYKLFSGVMVLFQSLYYLGWILLFFVILFTSKRIERIKELHQKEVARIQQKFEAIQEDYLQQKNENSLLRYQINNKQSEKK